MAFNRVTDINVFHNDVWNCSGSSAFAIPYGNPRMCLKGPGSSWYVQSNIGDVYFPAGPSILPPFEEVGPDYGSMHPKQSEFLDTEIIAAHRLAVPIIPTSLSSIYYRQDDPNAGALFGRTEYIVWPYVPFPEEGYIDGYLAQAGVPPGIAAYNVLSGFEEIPLGRLQNSKVHTSYAGIWPTMISYVMVDLDFIREALNIWFQNIPYTIIRVFGVWQAFPLFPVGEGWDSDLEFGGEIHVFGGSPFGLQTIPRRIGGYDLESGQELSYKRIAAGIPLGINSFLTGITTPIPGGPQAGFFKSGTIEMEPPDEQHFTVALTAYQNKYYNAMSVDFQAYAVVQFGDKFV